MFFITLATLSGCTPHSSTEKAEDRVTVQIPVQENSDSYQLKEVSLLGILDLTTVSGQFASFFYSPGSTGTALTGNAPKAHFVHAGHVFVPTDVVSAQMATIYYHTQSLALLDDKVGAGGVNKWPRTIGLETLVPEAESVRKNNAFYDGQTDAMMFVPFTNSELPISLNAGIIAHEHFHSLFYKIVLQDAIKNKKTLVDSASIHDAKIVKSASDDVKMKVDQKMVRPDGPSEATLQFNEAYLRGVNEGLADFWGWVYTEDVDFMKWSLPDYVQPRSLTLAAADIGRYETQQLIKKNIDNFKFQGIDIHDAILGYSYKIGTPHARFLKNLANITANDNKVSVQEAKLVVAKDVVQFLRSLKEKMLALKNDEVINAGGLFQFIADQKTANKTMTESVCQFLVPYLNNAPDRIENLVCETKDGEVTMAKVAR